MKISELEEILKGYRGEFGNLNISFGTCEEGVSIPYRDVDINFDEHEKELNIIVI
ncbi:MAG: hypothetical protein ACRCX8_19435 [Sarcina sp.]